MLKQIVVFTKAQVSALIGGAIDFSLMIFFAEVFHLHYTIGIVIGGIVGAIINFSLNKYWTFHSKGEAYANSMKEQMMKFSATTINSIFLKSTGTLLITSFFGINYKITRLMVDLIVSLSNYTLQKTWVFKKHSKKLQSEKKIQINITDDFFRKKKVV